MNWDPPTLVAARSVRGSGDYQREAARRIVDRLANIYLWRPAIERGGRFFLKLAWCVTSVLTPGNKKEFRAVCTGTGFLQFLRALGKCGTV